MVYFALYLRKYRKQTKRTHKTQKYYAFAVVCCLPRFSLKWPLDTRLPIENQS